jgi:hypothetical protein
MDSGDEKELTGEYDGGDMKIGKKKRKLISAQGEATKKKGKKHKKGKKAHHKKVSKK